jgi:hypothetical protein
MSKITFITAAAVLLAASPAAANYSNYRHSNPVRITMPGFNMVSSACHGRFYRYGTFKTCAVTNGRTALKACARACSH